MPDASEFKERYDDGRRRALLTGPLRQELADGDDEELLSVDVFSLWREPSVQEGRGPLPRLAT